MMSAYSVGTLMAPTRPRKFPLGWLYSLSSTLKAFWRLATVPDTIDGPAGEFGASFVDFEAELLSEFLDLVDIGGIGAVGVFELGARHGLEAGLFQSGF